MRILSAKLVQLRNSLVKLMHNFGFDDVHQIRYMVQKVDQYIKNQEELSNNPWKWFTPTYTRKQFDTASAELVAKLVELDFVIDVSDHVYDTIGGSYTTGWAYRSKDIEIVKADIKDKSAGQPTEDRVHVGVTWMLQDDGGDPYVVFEIRKVRSTTFTKTNNGIKTAGIEYCYPHMIPKLGELIKEVENIEI